MSAQPSLLTWKEDAEMERIGAERRALTQRIAELRPHSHLRLELTGRLKALTELQLRMELRKQEIEPC